MTIDEKGLTEMKVILARMETKQDHLLEKMDDHVVDDRRVHDDMEVRLRALEQSKWTVQGWATAAGALGGVIFSFLFDNS